MWILAGLIASLLLAVLIYLASQNGRFHVLRSLEIDATVESVYAAVLDLKSWPLWSPWLMHEAGARLDYSETVDAEGGYCSWDGRLSVPAKLPMSRSATAARSSSSSSSSDPLNRWARLTGNSRKSAYAAW